MNEALAEKISTEVYEKVKKYGAVTMIGIEKIFRDNGFEYQGSMALQRGRNIILWLGWKSEAFQVLNKCLAKGLKFGDTSEKSYYYKDEPLDLPVFDLPILNYKNFSNLNKNELDENKKYWLPSALYL